MGEVRVVASGIRFPEGPVAMADGSVVLTEISAGAVSRVTAAGDVTTIAITGGGPNGLAVGPDGAFYVCNNGGMEFRDEHFLAVGPAKSYAGGSIQRIDGTTHEVRTLYSHSGAHKLSAPNDIVFDAHGGFYFTDMGKKHARHRDHGGVYYARIDGSEITEVAYPVSQANGICLSPDGKTLYVVETETSRLWGFSILEPGVLRKNAFPSSPHGGELICGLSGYQQFDGLAVDANGNICVATLMTGHITVIEPNGHIARRVKMPSIFPTNICFGGPNLRTVYVTLADVGQLVALDWPDPGLNLNYMA